ncbi:hypothetical protein [Brassicibacter mesophilus]|uniref:hypothetical protein n=1 Tax=Brassicibacter mesophilus TaxID=745119 RepID=UPI003D1AC48F
MKRNSILALGLSLVVATGLLAGCGTKEEPANNETTQQENQQTTDTNQSESKYQDGTYFAQQNFDEKTGWKYMVTIEVKDGKIVAADWNGANKDAGKDKKTLSKDGEYVMVEGGTPWHEQAKKMEDYLIEKQDPKAIAYTDDDGHVDVVSGVSIKCKDFFELADQALASAPIEKGPYKDGAYHAEQKEFSENSGWKSTVDITVINGNIVAASWNAAHKDGGDDKNTQSANGQYVMKEGGTPWHEQADTMEAFLLEKQDPKAITYTDDDGHVDVVSGVSIKVAEFFELAEEALSQAK